MYYLFLPITNKPAPISKNYPVAPLSLCVGWFLDKPCQTLGRPAWTPSSAVLTSTFASPWCWRPQAQLFLNCCCCSSLLAGGGVWLAGSNTPTIRTSIDDFRYQLCDSQHNLSLDSTARAALWIDSIIICNRGIIIIWCRKKKICNVDNLKAVTNS